MAFCLLLMTFSWQSLDIWIGYGLCRIGPCYIGDYMYIITPCLKLILKYISNALQLIPCEAYWKKWQIRSPCIHACWLDQNTDKCCTFLRTSYVSGSKKISFHVRHFLWKWFCLHLFKICFSTKHTKPRRGSPSWCNSTTMQNRCIFWINHTICKSLNDLECPKAVQHSMYIIFIGLNISYHLGVAASQTQLRKTILS